MAITEEDIKATIEQDINDIETAIYGRDVRSAIADGIRHGYVNAHGAREDVAEFSNNVIKSQTTQPESQYNKVWLKPTGIDTVLAENSDIAPIFVDGDQNAYSAGSYVYYYQDKRLYRFNVDHKAKTAWNFNEVSESLPMYEMVAIRNNYAVPFDDSISYSAGWYTYYVPDNAIYRFLEAHVPNSGWDPTKVVRVTVFDELKRIENDADTAIEQSYTLNQNNGSVVPNNTDYNTLTSCGNYYVNSGSNAATMTNCPTSAAHRLTVMYIFSSNRLCQVVQNISNDIYIRSNSGSWGAWKKIALTSDIDTEISDYLPIRRSRYTEIAENSDYNTKTTAGVYFCNSASKAATMTNCPVSSANILIQQYTTTSDRYVQYCISADGLYWRYYTGAWGDWRRIINDSDVANAFIASSVSLPSGDLDNVRGQNTIYLISSSKSYQHTPDNRTTGFLQVMVSDGWTLQIFYGWSDGKMWKRRANSSGIYTEWLEISGDTINNNTYNNTYENTYNITTSPTITTDTHGWLQAVDTDTADETGKTDMTGAIMSMLTDVGYCHLGEGIFYVSGGIDMPANSMLCGCGDKTQIRLLQSTSSGYCVKLTDYSTIKDVSFSGSRSSIAPTSAGTRDAIRFVGGYTSTPQVRTQHCTIDNVVIRNFSGSGIYCNNTSLSPEHGLYATNVYVTNCYAGIYIYDYSDFHKFTNICTNACYYGVINNGGNNVFTACTFRATNTGFYVDGTKYNPGHGTLNGCTFCHIGGNAGSAITMENVGAGFVVSGCQFWYNTVDLTGCQGVVFSGCEFGNGITGTNAIINISGGKTIMFNGCMFRYSDPVINGLATNDKVKFNGCYEAESGDVVDPTAA